MNIPAELRYTESHEWVRAEGSCIVVGITDHAQAELGDIVFLELPKVGSKVAAKQSLATIESVKAASDIYAPLAGEVIEVNSALTDDLSAVNSDPFGSWFFKIALADPSQIDSLLDASAYEASLPKS